MLRRALLQRAAILAPAMVASATAACAPPLPPSRSRAAPQQLTLLAGVSAGRRARVEAWNQRFGRPSGFELELGNAPEPDGRPLSARSLAALLAARPGVGQLAWIEQEDVTAMSLLRLLRPLDDLVRRERFDLKRFMPVALQPAYALDERLYALPEEVEARQLYFHLDHLMDAGIDVRRAGLDFREPAMTWESLRRVLLRLLASPRSNSRLPLHPGHEGAPLELWGWQSGGEWVDKAGRHATFMRAENVDALAWLAGVSHEIGGAERLASTGPFPAPARLGSGEDQPERHPFVNGRVSLCVESTRFVSTLAGARPDLKAGVVELPRRWPPMPLRSWSRSWGYGLVAQAPDAAWDVLRFLIGEDAAIVDAAAMSASAPVDRRDEQSGHTSRWWCPPFTGQHTLDPALARSYRTPSPAVNDAHDHGLEQLRHALFRAPTPAARELWPLLQEARERALLGAVSPQEALAAAQQEAQALLDAAWHVD